MIFKQDWSGRLCNRPDQLFKATVPGNIQYDYSVFKKFDDIYFADNIHQFLPLEDEEWEYIARLQYDRCADESVWFISRGIDYLYDIRLNGEILYRYEGMYRHVELDLTEKLLGNDILTIHVYPHPKRKNAPAGTRDQADESCKPPFCYGWDWNPRLLISGMWEDAWIETRNPYSISNTEALASLNEDLTIGTVSFTSHCEVACKYELYDEKNQLIACSNTPLLTVSSPKLWWCNGQGEPTLYRWVISNERECTEGKIGFRRIRLVRNTGARDPDGFPKSCYAPPATFELNGRRIFGKGSNWVNCELFKGAPDKIRYMEMLTLAKDANINFLRVWGGSGPEKDLFYQICDELGIMVWQEFMLACNNYVSTPHYMNVLEQEATAILKRLRSHPCIALWCGGNELFNGWSGMTTQSKALRLLNALCLRYDPDIPFNPTSPIDGMGHGGYQFEHDGTEVFQEFQKSSMTAYTEFGIPSASSVKTLKRIIPPEELFPPRATKSWVTHHGFGAWIGDAWLFPDTIEKYFGIPESLESLAENSQWLQAAGYQACYEEARRQWPHCGLAACWCFDEPWYTAANNSLIAYPNIPKPAYFSVKAALRPTIFSARIKKFSWKAREMLEIELWFLNDSPVTKNAHVSLSVEIGQMHQQMLQWDAFAEGNSNLQGPTARLRLPALENTDRLTVILTSDLPEYSNRYTLLYQIKKKSNNSRLMNH